MAPAAAERAPRAQVALCSPLAKTRSPTMPIQVVLSIAIGVGLWVQSHFFSSAVADDLTQNEATPKIARPAGPGASGATSRELVETWRRVRSPGSQGGTGAAAILHTADFARSDPRLAGLMLRCAEHGIEAIIVVVEPFPPHARPKITLHAAGQESYFEGDIIPTGAGIRLPVDGGNLATGAWFGSRELGIKITDGGSTIDGAVDLSGLRPALDSLIADCARK